jgi:hypothetical protein
MEHLHRRVCRRSSVLDLGGDSGGLSLDQGEIEGPFVLEMMVERTPRHSRLRGNLGRSGGGISLSDKKRFGRFKHPPTSGSAAVDVAPASFYHLHAYSLYVCVCIQTVCFLAAENKDADHELLPGTDGRQCRRDLGILSNAL